MRQLKLSKSDLRGFKLIGVGIAVLVLIGGAAAFVHSGKPVLDEHTLCPMTGEKTRVAVLVDKSDKWARGDVARVQDILQSIYRDVPTQGRLTIYSITGKRGKIPVTEVNLIFDACNPGNESECNALYKNCRKVKRDYKGTFQAPLEQLGATLMLPGESSYSPLLETVGTMVKDNKGKALKLHIVSDFMENHTNFRFYDLVPLDSEMVAAYPLPKKAEITVEGYFIQRRMHPMPLQNAVQAAWTGYFQKQGIPATFSPVFTTD
ncbi:MAG: hypothetical protein GZ085_03720 [Sulfuriferula multivorans]|uniref:Uncharacterized protein n=1 Tax=Sulfuriferula multivorans TaxID=1559896 RepID=A0A7C9K8G4_9PROT|nr:hypothetical protein [Sulfuriferula multivorans]